MIGYVSDQSGEDEIYVVSGDGKGQPVRVTTTGDCIKYGPVWSPDSKKMAWSDKNARLYFVDVDTKKTRLIDSSNVFEIREYGWSPTASGLRTANLRRTSSRQWSCIRWQPTRLRI